MGLIRCPKCGKEISEKARFCPNCGYPVGEIRKNLNNGNSIGCFSKFLLLFISLVLGVGFCAILDDSDIGGDKVKQSISKEGERSNLYVVSPLNVREKPSKDSKRLFVLPSGADVKVIETKGSWSKIVFQYKKRKIQGWVCNKYLSARKPKKVKIFDFSVVLKEGEIPRKIIKTKKGNFLAVGVKSGDYFDSDGLILLLDNKGRILFKKNVNSGYKGYMEYFNSVVETGTGNFVAVGSSPFPLYTRGLDIWVVRFGEDGFVYSKNYYDKKNKSDDANDVISLGKEKVLIAGYYAVTSDGGVDAAFLKVGANDKLLDEFVYGYASSDEVPETLLRIDNNSFISAGYWEDFSKKDHRRRPWVARIFMGRTNKVVWSKRIPYVGHIVSIVKTGDNNFIALADTHIDNQDKVLLFKMDMNGNMLWKKFLLEKPHLEAKSIIRYHDNAFIVGINVKDPKTEKWYIRLIKIDGAGNIIWRKAIPTKGRSVVLESFTCLDDGSLIVAASIRLKDGAKGWIFKVNPDKVKV
jgi:uncharacterized protein YgiM (DUF1202 family)